MLTSREIRRIYIEEDMVESAIGRNVIARVPSSAKIEIVPSGRAILDDFIKGGARTEKDSLLVYKFPGRFVSSCPGSDGMVCCQYFVINFGVGCLFDCHYCYLQSFVNNPLMTVFGNLEDLFREIDQKISGKKFQFRIGTGEYTDSLALEDLTGISRALVEHFAGLPNATLELKTKSANVDGILDAHHNGRTVVAWSVNPPRVIQEVEEGTADLEERLAAAEKVQAAGYRIAFHLDPVIHFDGWEEEYHALIDRIFSRIRPDNVAWISLGGFRYSPGLKETVQARFPDDRL
ncbi:MAG: DNA photolyase, partial [Spirochaetia bacterium]|nr:DNA photolyase [Spirochaetia bacterium]